jgi:hypothetical protein
MVEPGMNCAGIYQVGKSHLVDVPQPLVYRVGYDAQYQRVINRDKPVNGIIDYFSGARHCWIFVKGEATKVQMLGLISYFWKNGVNGDSPGASRGDRSDRPRVLRGFLIFIVPSSQDKQVGFRNLKIGISYYGSCKNHLGRRRD